jgi:hypothetical protein
MKSSRGAVLMVGAEDAPLVIVVEGAVFFGEDGAGATTRTGSEASSGFADVMVVADVGVTTGAAEGGGGVVAEGGSCGVDKTATVTPKRIMPATATTHVIVLRSPFRRGTSTVARSCDDVSLRFEEGAGEASASGAAAPCCPGRLQAPGRR